MLTSQTTKDMQETLEIHDPWLLVHRVDLHQKLKEFSQRDGPTAKPTLHLRSAVKSAVSDARSMCTLTDHSGL